MHTRALCAVVLATLAGPGCAPSPSSPSDGGGGGSGGGDSSAGVTYTRDVKPILMAKCAPCHTTTGLGMHNVATDYQFVDNPVHAALEPGAVDTPEGCFNDGRYKMDPKTIGECILVAVMVGWMPQGMFCHETPRPAACVTLAQQDIIAAWVAAGMPE